MYGSAPGGRCGRFFVRVSRKTSDLGWYLYHWLIVAATNPYHWMTLVGLLLILVLGEVLLALRLFVGCVALLSDIEEILQSNHKYTNQTPICRNISLILTMGD